MYVRFETRRSGRGLFAVLARVRAEPHKLRRHRAELERLANRLWDDTPAVEEEMYDARARMPRPRTWWGPGAGALARDAWEFRRLARRAGIRLRVLVSREAPGAVRWSDEVQAVIFAETRAMRQAVVKPRGVERRAERWNGDRSTIRRMRPRAQGGVWQGPPEARAATRLPAERPLLSSSSAACAADRGPRARLPALPG